MPLNQLGQNIHNLLVDRNMKPIELARQANIDRGYLSRILQGRSLPSLELLERIADTLGVAVQTLFEGEAQETRDLTAQLQRDPKLRVALRKLRELSDEDKAQVISIIQRFAASAEFFDS